MKLREILSQLNTADIHANLDMEIAGLCYDSHEAVKGSLFFAIEGFERDGHDFIGSAIENGASAIVCTRRPDEEVPYVLVSDARLALAVASKNFYGDPASGMTLIGVTGTNGKTTVTSLIKKMLEDIAGAKTGLIGTNRNMIGSRELSTERTTPESCELYKLLREMKDEGCTHVVMEVSSHALELHRVSGLWYEIGVFTNLTQDHLDFHKNMENYARAKSKLFTMCGKAVINLDDKYAEQMARMSVPEVFTYSAERNDAGLVAKDIRLSSKDVRFFAMSGDSLEKVTLNIPCRFSVYNALSVISCGLALGFPLASISQSLKDARGVKGRMEVVPTDGDYAIIIDYAHTPDALENVLKSMSDVAQGRVVAVFGCGGDRDTEKRPLMGAIAARYANFVIVTSDNPRTEEPAGIIRDIVKGMRGTNKPYKIIEDRRQAIAYAIENHHQGDTIILAGKGHETYQIVGKTKYPMDEREIVAQCLAKRETEQGKSE